ncbi:RNA-binding protein Musashi-like protein Rbp6 [Temnothorax longispinosus]|uniref:RNA-binding protein Musashi-like protein Rbp6 n=1 Tax=Temnothorax longispinosus TaxID=300112 RepID=A0A4S2KDA7_9HYME|nr:RNA-binding protein Musashi-like protein Rbp6 [Temnothorax longispinosus]
MKNANRFASGSRRVAFLRIVVSLIPCSWDRPAASTPLAHGVELCLLIYPCVHGCPAGFGFITFADPASVDKVLAQGNHELDGKKVSNHHILPD